MRLSEHPSVTVEIDVAADPNVVWALVTDLDAMGAFSPEYQGGEWLDPADGPVIGARFEGRNERNGRTWTSMSTVTASDPGRLFEFAVGDPSAAGAWWRFELEPTPSGTRLKQIATMGSGNSGLSRAVAKHPKREEQIVFTRLEMHRENMTVTLGRLKAAAEGS